MKYKDSQGNFQDIYVKVGDNIPVGGEMDFDGDNIPVGWEEVDNPNNYSTTEQKIGTWIDGKPLYRKVIYFKTVPTNETLEIQNISDWNISTLVQMYGCLNHAISNNKRPLPLASNGSDDIRIDINEGKLRIITYSSWSGYNKNYIVLEYTKTTD